MVPGVTATVGKDHSDELQANKCLYLEHAVQPISHAHPVWLLPFIIYSSGFTDYIMCVCIQILRTNAK